MALSTVDALACWEQSPDDCKLSCEERFVINEMQNFPPRNEGIVRGQFAFCVCKSSRPKLSICGPCRRGPGQRMFEQLLTCKRKTERLMVPDLATEWYRKQKDFLDTVTYEEQLELEDQARHWDEAFSLPDFGCKCKHCTCHERKGPPSVKYLNYCQELRRRRLLLQRQRQQLQVGEKLCCCHNPAGWPFGKRLRRQAGKRTSDELPAVENDTQLGRGVTVCKPMVAGCKADASTDKAGRIAGGMAAAKVKVCRMYPIRTCQCLRSGPREPCACLFQADGQPMAEECAAALRGRIETPMPHLRRKYNLREVPHRRLDPACFRRISPEFYSLLKSYEEGMSERYPLYGLPIRYWTRGTPCCVCEQPPASGLCEEQCLGDQSVAEGAEWSPCRKSDDAAPEADCCGCPVDCAANVDTPALSQKSSYTQFCEVDNCPALNEDYTRTTCEQNRCQGECLTDQAVPTKQSEAETPFCTSASCPNRNTRPETPAVNQTESNLRENYDAERPQYPQRDLPHAVLQGRPKNPSVPEVQVLSKSFTGQSKDGASIGYPDYRSQQSLPLLNTNAMAMVATRPLTATDKSKSWFSTKKLSKQCCSTDGSSCKDKRKGVLGSVAGLCKRAMLPGRYLLYSLSNLSRTPAHYECPKLTRKRLKEFSDSHCDSDSPSTSKPQATFCKWRCQHATCGPTTKPYYPASPSYLSRKPMVRPCCRVFTQQRCEKLIHEMRAMPAHQAAWNPTVNRVAIEEEEVAARSDESLAQRSLGEDTSMETDPRSAGGHKTPSLECSEASKSMEIETMTSSSEEPTENREQAPLKEKPKDVKSLFMSEFKRKDKPQYCRAARRNYVSAADYMQLMRMVARKRPKTRPPKQQRVTFADKPQTQQNERKRCRTPPQVSPDRSRSASPAPKKMRPNSMLLPDLSGLRGGGPVHSLDFLKNRQGIMKQPSEATWFSAQSKDSSLAKDKYQSCESQASTWASRPKVTAKRQIRPPSDETQSFYSALSGSRLSDNRIAPKSVQNRSQPGKGQKPKKDTERQPQKPQHSAESIARRARIVRDLKQGLRSADTSMDTVARNNECLANITRYSMEEYEDVKTVSSSVSQGIFSSRPNVNVKLMRMRDALPKLKVRTPFVKTPNMVRTRGSSPRSVERLKQAELEQRNHQAQPKNSGYLPAVEMRFVQRQPHSRYGQGTDFSDPSANDMANGRRRSRSGCDVPFEENDARSSSAPLQNAGLLEVQQHETNSYVLPSKRGSFKGYATPCSSKCCLRGGTVLRNVSESSSNEEFRHAAQREIGRRTERRLLDQEHFPATRSKSMDSGRRAYPKERPVKEFSQQLFRDVEYVHTPATPKKGASPAFRDAFDFPQSARRRFSQSSIESTGIAQPAIQWTDDSPNRAPPNSILKSPQKSQKLVPEMRHVNFLPEQRSNSCIYTCGRSAVVTAEPFNEPSSNSRRSSNPRSSRTMEMAPEPEIGQPHSFSFVHQGTNAATRPGLTAPMRNDCQLVEQDLPEPSIFAVATTANQHSIRMIDSYSFNKRKEVERERLTTRAKTEEELQLEESRLPLNSQLLSKRSDYVANRRSRNERPNMPPGVALVSDLAFTTHVAPSRDITEKFQVQERGGNIQDVPLMLSVVLDQVHEKNRNRDRSEDNRYEPDPGVCQYPRQSEASDEPQTPDAPSRRPQYPCFPHELMGNSQVVDDNYYPRRRCCLRRLPQDPVVIEPTHVGLRVEQLRQNCLPMLFYGRKC